MSEFWVFDIYTGISFVGVVLIAACYFFCVYLVKQFPRQAEWASGLLLPAVFLLMLGFCGLQIAATARMNAKYNQSKGQE